MQLISLLIYNLSVRLYGLGVLVAALFNPKAKLWVEGRKGQRAIKLPDATTGGKRIWVHCASLGEFEQARPVIEKIKANHSNSFIILTFFSPSGYEIRKNYTGADVVLYLPLDTANNARTFLNNIKPDVALFVKYEFWYYYLTELKRRQIPTVLFSAIFRPEQIFFKWYGGLFRNLLGCYDKIFVQNKESQDLLKRISIESQISFDTRFDRVYQVAQAAKAFPLIEKFKGSNKVLVAGSTWSKDEQLIVKLINEQVLTDYKYIIAPHNLNTSEISKLQSLIQSPALLLSQLTNSNADSPNVIIVDTMGDLSSIYRYANLVYVGGGFNASVHNVLEPAVYGVPIIFGPNHLKSAEAKDLIQEKAAFAISDYNQLQSITKKLNTDSLLLNTADTKSKQYVETRLGGVNDIYQHIVARL